MQLWPELEASQAVRVEPTAKRVRALLGNSVVADSARVMIMFETARLPVYYFPVEDVRTDLLSPGSRTATSPQKGKATYYSIATAGGRNAANAAWRYLDPPARCPDIRGHIAFHWHALDGWYEEDEEVFGHAHDPYHRIDVLESSRHVQVVIHGRTVADSKRPRLLFETGLPTRYYLPRLDVQLDLLQPSERRSICAYKGTTSQYWAATMEDGSLEEVAWCYGSPALECAKVANLVCFFNERVDLHVDGVMMPRPNSPWS